MKKIVVSKEVTIELSKMFAISRRAVFYALDFTSQSPRAEKIRETAMKMGGKLYETKLVQPDRAIKPVKVIDRKGNVVRTINA